MKHNNFFIFDLDGTLYQFDKAEKNSSGRTRTYDESDFKKDLHTNVRSLFQGRLAYTDEEWNQLVRDMEARRDSEYSLVAASRGVERKEYFDYVWDFDPSKYVLPNEKLKSIFEITRNNLLISNAPGLWVSRVLSLLGIGEYFNSGNLFTGELEIRKPNPKIFKTALEYFGAEPSRCYSIGDQEVSDIIPAQSLGMNTIMVGKRINCTPTHEIDSIDELLGKLSFLKIEN